MKIFVNATALNSRGSMTVIQNFLKEMRLKENFLRKNNIYLMVAVSVKKLEIYDSQFIKILLFEKIKKNWWNKFFFENRILPNLLVRENINAYLSLQNYALKNIRLPQFVLIHQAIPFSDLNITELEFKNLIKYKFLLKFLFTLRLKHITGLIVQTNWMKEKIHTVYKKTINIKVFQPVNSIYLDTEDCGEKRKNEKQIFKPFVNLLYVTNKEKYKNNKRLIKAIEKYNSENEVKVYLTLTLHGKNQPFVNFIGKIDHAEMPVIYKNADALIFPSLVESLGLPLLEAQKFNLNIIASNLPYAKEICGDQAIYFDPRDIQSISHAIEKYVYKRKGYFKDLKKIDKKKYDGQDYLSYISFIEETVK